MMNKRLKQGSTFLLAVALTFPLLTLPGAKAASAIDTDAECSIQFDIGGNSELLNDDVRSICTKLHQLMYPATIPQPVHFQNWIFHP